MRRVVLVVLAACGGSSHDGPTASVIALSGDAPEPAASVLSHRADGSIIDTVMPDPTGHAEVAIEPGALITVVFPSMPPQIVTTLAPAGDLTVHGPPADPSPSVAGALGIMPVMALGAASYDVELGCLTVHEPQLPATIDVIGPCLGSDENLDILIHGRDGAGTEVGYAAGRVALNGDVAEFDPPMWLTSGTPVPVTVEGVAATVTWALYADGLAFDRATITGGATLPTGLAVDAMTVAITADQRVTTESFTTAPTAIAVSAADLLPPVTPMPARSGDALSWTAPSLSAAAVDVRITWSEGVWDVVGPPDLASVVLPAITNTPALPSQIAVRYLAATGVTDFSAITEMFAEQTGDDDIVALPPDGRIQVSWSQATL